MDLFASQQEHRSPPDDHRFRTPGGELHGEYLTKRREAFRSILVLSDQSSIRRVLLLESAEVFALRQGFPDAKVPRSGNDLRISFLHSYLGPKGRAGFVMSSPASIDRVDILKSH